MNTITQQGLFDRVSDTAIDAESLSKIIENIILKHRILRPVFEGNQCHRYSELNSAHTWAEQEDKIIYSLMQIPMADMSDSNHVRILSPANILFSDLGVALLNKKLRYYRFLSDTDYLNCVNTENLKVCQKRHIKISYDPDCNPNMCKKWANIVAHDLTHTEIIVIQETTTSATLDCINQKERTVQIPT